MARTGASVDPLLTRTITQPFDDALAAVDFFDDPYPVYDAMRASAPVYWSERFLAWIVTGYADVDLSGTLASVGARLIEGTADKMITQTFDCMRTKLET